MSSAQQQAPPVRICVYCGASAGKKPAHMEAARELARVMAANNIHLVYGGGTVGLMGELAKTLVSLSGPEAVHGIIPEPLVKYERDPAYTSNGHNNNGNGNGTASSIPVPDESRYGKTTIVEDMHARKHMMAQEVFNGGPGSGFIALSGGYGTMEELLETTTWNQLGLHRRGICVLNVDGYYDGLLAWIRNSVAEGFIAEDNGRILVTATNAADAVKALREYQVSDAVFKLPWGKA